MADLVQCRSPFAVTVGGARLIVSSGDIYPSDDPVVKGREALFTEVAVKSSRPRTPVRSLTGGATETAEASPASRRRLTRPKDESKAGDQPEKNEV